MTIFLCCTIVEMRIQLSLDVYTEVELFSFLERLHLLVKRDYLRGE